MSMPEPMQPGLGPTTRQITFAQAVNEALAEEMRRDPDVLLMREDIGGDFGGGLVGKRDRVKLVLSFHAPMVAANSITMPSSLISSTGLYRGHDHLKQRN